MTDEYEEVTDSMIRSARPRWPAWVACLAALAGGGGASAYLLHELRGARAQTAAAQARTLEAEAKLEATQRARGEAEARLEKLAAERTELEARQSELSRSVEAKDEELARIKAAADELEEKMRAEIARGDVSLSRAGGQLKVDLVDKVLFDSGDARISRRGEGILARVAAVLGRVEDRQIQVAGHTDDAPISPRLKGRYPTNWELSTSRATNVVRFLEERAHIPPARLVATGYGPFHPVASNATPRGRARNRRIEILLAPTLDPTPARLEVAQAEPARPVQRAAPAKKAARQRYANAKRP